MLKARLVGDAFDLQTLASIFDVGDPTVSVDADGDYFLEATSFGALNEGAKVLPVAEALLEKMNGASRMHDISYRPVYVTGEFRDDRGVVTRMLTSDIRARVDVVSDAEGGSVPEEQPEPPATAWVSLGETNTEMAKVLGLLGSESRLSWETMYKVMEIIRRDVRGEAAMFAHRWVTKKRMSAFTWPANEARHAGTSGDRPKHPMTVDEARAWIQTLFLAWAEWIAAGEPPPV